MVALLENGRGVIYVQSRRLPGGTEVNHEHPQDSRCPGEASNRAPSACQLLSPHTVEEHRTTCGCSHNPVIWSAGCQVAAGAVHYDARCVNSAASVDSGDALLRIWIIVKYCVGTATAYKR